MLPKDWRREGLPVPGRTCNLRNRARRDVFHPDKHADLA